MDGSAWSKRNARAQALGYRNYYDYRVHNFGKLPAGQPAPTGADLARLRGHRGHKDALRRIRSGKVVSASVTGSGRDSTGQFQRVDVFLVGDDGGSDLYSFDWDEADIDELVLELDDDDVPYIYYPAGVGE